MFKVTLVASGLFAFMLVVALPGQALAAPAALKIETTTGKKDSLGCTILKSRDGYKRAFIYKKAGHWKGRAVAVVLKAMRNQLTNNMEVYQMVRNKTTGAVTYGKQVSTMKKKFEGNYCGPGCENVLKRPAFQEYGPTMTQVKARYGSIALVVRRKGNAAECYTWLIDNPTNRYD